MYFLFLSSDSDESSDDDDDNNYFDDSDDNASLNSASSTQVQIRQSVKTKGELDITDLPPIEDLKISVDEDQCQPVGCIKNIVDTLGKLIHNFLIYNDMYNMKVFNYVLETR